MTDMVEKVAKAIYERMPYDEPHGQKPAWVPNGNSLKQDEARTYARTAIRALMEPTEEMLKAGRKPLASGAIGEDIVWQAMLKAALDD